MVLVKICSPSSQSRRWKSRRSGSDWWENALTSTLLMLSVIWTHTVEVKLQNLKSVMLLLTKSEYNTTASRWISFSYILIRSKKVLWSTQNSVMRLFPNPNSASKSFNLVRRRIWKIIRLTSRCSLSIQENFIDYYGIRCYKQRLSLNKKDNYCYKIHILMCKRLSKLLKA